MEQWTIYMHTSMKSGKSYIGMTKVGVDKRWKRHINDANNGNDVHFHRAIRLYGPTNWEHLILADSIDTLQEAEALEVYFIKLYDTFESGYNSTYGGPGASGVKMTEENKIKLGKRSLGRKTSEYSKRLQLETRRRNLPKYNWVHFSEGKATLSTVELAAKCNVSTGNASSVVAGNNISCSGWELDNGQIPKNYSCEGYGVITLYHEYLGTLVGTVESIAMSTELVKGNIIKVLKGERLHTKGYVLEEKDMYGLQIVTEIPLEFTHKDGRTFTGTAKELKLKYGLNHVANISKVLLGERKRIYGWGLTPVEESTDESDGVDRMRDIEDQEYKQASKNEELEMKLSADIDKQMLATQIAQRKDDGTN